MAYEDIVKLRLTEITEALGAGVSTTALSVSEENSASILSITQAMNDKISDNLTIPSSIGHISNTNISNVTATRIDATSHTCKQCIVTALEGNTSFIRIGGSSITTTTGILLYANESITLDISNSNLLYAIAGVNGEDISVTYLS